MDGFDPNQAFGEIPPQIMQQAPQGMPPGMPQGMPPEGAPQEEMPPNPEEVPVGPDDPHMQDYRDHMMGHMGAISDKIEEDPGFKEKLAQAPIGADLLHEIAHWSKDRVLELLEDLVDNPVMLQELHSAFEKSRFHGHRMLEEWREGGGAEGRSEEMADPEGALGPNDDDVVQSMDEDSGPAPVESIHDFVMKKSGKKG